MLGDRRNKVAAGLNPAAQATSGRLWLFSLVGHMQGQLFQPWVDGDYLRSANFLVTGFDVCAFPRFDPVEVVSHPPIIDRALREVEAAGRAQSEQDQTAGITPSSIEAAARDLAQYLPPTPLQYSRAFTDKARCYVHIKIESIQPIRAFKVRGALTKVMRLHPEERSAGVITASAGNHGQGVAYAAAAFKIPATVYVPETANQLKVEAIRRLGAEVVPAGRNYNDAYLEAIRQQERGGATFVHAFDDPDVIAGQGS